MAETAFTPGPWAISSVSMETGAIGIAKDRIMIAEVHNGYSFMDVVQGNHPKEQWANAGLIAAAPDLCEVARMVVEASDLSGVSGPLADAARAALAKASAS